MELLQWLRSIFIKKQKAVADEIVVDDLFKVGETLTPNIRALRLAISVSDALLGMGVAASDVVGMGLDIVNRYCNRQAQLDISYTNITLSQDRGDDREPLTLIRSLTPRHTNNMMIQSLQQLVREIRKGTISLEDAEKLFDHIINNPQRHRRAVTTIGSGAISAGVAILYTGSPIIVVLSFCIGASVAFVIEQLRRQQVPAFYSQVIASVIITLVAAGIAWLGGPGGWGVFAGINPTLIVIGGIVMLVAGLAIVGAVQDAIDEYYLTASAKILRVIMMTIGIVAGVLIGLYIARLAGVDITVVPEKIGLRAISWQYVGAIMIAAGFALSNHSRGVGVLLAGFLGWFAWYISLIATTASLSIIAASAIAAMGVGAFASLFSRAWGVPSVAMISAGIVPLVPGMTLYNGLMQLVNAQTNSWTLNDAMITLFTALLIALAIAAGASFGILIGRPLRRTLVRRYNRLPRRNLTN